MWTCCELAFNLNLISVHSNILLIEQKATGLLFGEAFIVVRFCIVIIGVGIGWRCRKGNYRSGLNTE